MHTLTVRHFAHATTLALRGSPLSATLLSVRERIATRLTVVHIDARYVHKLKDGRIDLTGALEASAIRHLDAGAHALEIASQTREIGASRDIDAFVLRPIAGIETSEGNGIACVMTGSVVAITGTSTLENRRDLGTVGASTLASDDGNRLRTTDGEVILFLGSATQLFLGDGDNTLAGTFDSAIKAWVTIDSHPLAQMRIRNTAIAGAFILDGASAFARISDLAAMDGFNLTGPDLTIDLVHDLDADLVTLTSSASAEMRSILTVAATHDWGMNSTDGPLAVVGPLSTPEDSTLKTTGFSGFEAFFLMENGIPFETETNHKIQVTT